MSRFERKCFVGSAIMHGSLLLVFFFGAAFLPSKKSEKLPPVITLLAIPTDRPISSGGNPTGNPEPPAPAPQPEKPEPPQPPAPVPPKPEPKIEKVEPRKELVPAPEKDKGDVPVQAKKQPDKKQTETASTKPRISTKTVIRTNNTARLERERADREMASYKAERQRLAAQVGGIIGGVGKSLNKSTVAEPLGPGGAAYANYASLVAEHYRRAVYASQPQSDDDAEALIRIVVSRDGTVNSSQWVRRTGQPVLDKAVDRAMNSVRRLPHFPPETKDSERSFNITIPFEVRRVSA